MGCPSLSIHRGLIHWQGLLLVVSLLNFWSQSTTAQMRVQSTDVIKGKDAILSIYNKPCDATYFLWYRGKGHDISSSIAYLSVDSGIYVRYPPDGRVTVNNDGSLVIKNVTMEDSGVYTVIVRLQGCQKLVSCGWVNVYPRVDVPTLLVSNTSVTENKDAVVFSCSTIHDGIEWFFEGRRLMITGRMKLSMDRRNLTIDPVLRWDAGEYQCKASNPRTGGKSARIKLDVKFD